VRTGLSTDCRCQAIEFEHLTLEDDDGHLRPRFAVGAWTAASGSRACRRRSSSTGSHYRIIAKVLASTNGIFV
jgi:hypothetical protein